MIPCCLGAVDGKIHSTRQQQVSQTLLQTIQDELRRIHKPRHRCTLRQRIKTKDVEQWFHF